MHTTLFPGRAPVTAPIVGTDQRFPIARLYCVGRNYAAHAREMGHDPDRDPPFFFAKDADAWVPDGTQLPYPPETHNFHPEVELVVALGTGGFRVPAEDASALIFGYAVGFDMTRRDLQSVAKDHGRPWCMAKNFPGSAPLGPIRPRSDTGLMTSGVIALSVNGQTRQKADIADMTWSVAETIAHLSRFVALKPGDLIFTGTPEGVGAVDPGDILVGTITGLPSLTVTISDPVP